MGRFWEPSNTAQMVMPPAHRTSTGDDDDTLVPHMSQSSTPSSPPLSAIGASPSVNAGLLYVAFTTSGAAGLIYEVMWARSFSLIFGSTTRAAAVVLAAFFTGLALGSLLGASLAKRRSTAALRFAAAERREARRKGRRNAPDA